ncbi:MAG: hypothetical protein OEV80_11630, partial [candidate division Zixibacteria bacterium]|nr:hypothetical protein [candidate division Zixibacteria bacterium]
MRQSNWTILLNSVIIMLITSVAALSAVPPYMNYQGRLTDDVGNPIDTTAAMTFTLYTDDGTNTVLWTETHPPVTVTDGLFQVFLGAYNNLSPDLFDGSTRLLGVQLGAGPENSPRTTIVSVAYALVAAKADTAAYAYAAPGSGTNPGWVDDGATVRLTSSGDNVGIGTSTPTEKLDVNGNARVGGVLDVDGQLHISGGTPEITSELDFINFDSTRLNILGRVTMGSAFGNRRLQVSTDGTMDTIAFQAVNLTGTAGSFFSGADGLSYSSISAAVNAYADGPSYAGRFRAAGEGLGLFARTDGAGSAVHGNAAGTGYSGYFEGGLGFKVDGDFEATGSLKLPTGAGNGLVLTSDALGVASWQSAAGSPWSFNGSTVYLSDTATKGAVGITAPLTNKKFSVQTKGTNTTMALWVRNSLGTAAAFFSGDTGTTSPGVHSAVYARSGGDNNAGFFSAGGSGEGIVATSSGSGEALRTNAYGTGYSGRFSGGQGVLIDGDLKVTGPLTLPSGAAIGHVLTSDGFGNASWQPGVDASPWTQQGDFIDQVDTSAQVRIGSRLITDGPKLIVEKNGVGAATALRVRNTMGTAARFYSGTTQSSVSVWNAALHAYGHNGSHAGIFQALGDDVDCVKAV